MTTPTRNGRDTTDLPPLLLTRHGVDTDPPHVPYLRRVAREAAARLLATPAGL
jgi:hypothetical protein